MRSDRGATLVELSIVIPCVILLIWGLLAFALHIMESFVFHMAVFIAARTALVQATDVADSRARQFLATTLRSLDWLIKPLGEITGCALTVKKTGRQVQVSLTKEPGLLSELMAGGGRWFDWIGSNWFFSNEESLGDRMHDLQRTFKYHTVTYTLGRPAR